MWVSCGSQQEGWKEEAFLFLTMYKILYQTDWMLIACSLYVLFVCALISNSADSTQENNIMHGWPKL